MSRPLFGVLSTWRAARDWLFDNHLAGSTVATLALVIACRGAVAGMRAGLFFSQNVWFAIIVLLLCVGSAFATTLIYSAIKDFSR